VKIAFVHFYTFQMLRGIETLVVSLSNELVNLGAEVSILTAKRSVEPLVVPDPRVNVYEFPVPRYFAHKFVAPQYAWNLIREQYDYVVFMFADFGEPMAWRLASPLTKTRMLVYLCYPYSAVPHRYDSMLRSDFFQEAAGILADAQYVADDAAPVVNRPIEVIPVGSDPARFKFDPDKRAAIRQKYGYRDEDLVLLNVSALEPRKGVRRVIEQLPRVLERVPNVRYLILGRGDDESTLREMVRQRGLEDIVTFAGTTTELPAYYSAADIFVMLPDSEANSVASHEALLCGLPAVVSASGGFLEVMRPEFARFINLNQMDQFAEAIEELSCDPAKRGEMGNLGRYHVENHLSWKSSAQKLMTYIKTLDVSQMIPLWVISAALSQLELLAGL
jgi:glycosyltransferase involved in cell wall biosynthesis